MFNKKEYQKKYDAEHYRKNKKHSDLVNKKWRQENVERFSELSKKSYQKNKHKHVKYKKKYYVENKDSIKTYRKKFHLKYPEKTKDYNLRAIYKITLKDYKSLLKKQNYKCAICSMTNSKSKIKYGKPLEVDHSHKTNRIRGLLCSGCNSGLGRFKDNVKRLNNAIKYLKTGRNNK